MKCILSKVFILVTLLLSGCSIITYEIQDELPETKSIDSCDIAFTFDLQSGSHTNSFGEKKHDDEKLKSLKESYITSTLSTLHELGCSTKQVPSVAESNFSIKVSRQLQISALPQEYLTGLSFGLIPSWGTKYGQYTYTFTHNGSDQSYSYTINQNNYNHLILFPVFWISFFTANEQETYKDALTNFIKSS